MQKKEKQLFDWEAELHAKKLEVNGLKQLVSQKQDRLTIESEQVSQKIEHLQNLTAQYENLFEKDKELQTGKDVQQVYDDFEVKGADRGEPWALSSKAKANRDNLEKVDTNLTL